MEWRLAQQTHGESVDDFACLTSEAAARSVIEDDADLREDEYRQKLIRGLILSGMAMEMAGSSRPSSGSEHLISHALDLILDEPRAHGLQVAVATIAATLLRGEDAGRLVGFFRGVGLPVVPGDLGISIDDFMTAVRNRSGARPGRTTCSTTSASRTWSGCARPICAPNSERRHPGSRSARGRGASSEHGGESVDKARSLAWPSQAPMWRSMKAS